jgi:hypothetical protein
MTPDKPRSVKPSESPDQISLDQNPSPPIPGRVLAFYVVAIVAVLVLGYLFLNKLVDISQEEDCGLAHRKNCDAIELSSGPVAA